MLKWTQSTFERHDGNVYIAILLRSYRSFESKLNALVRSTVPPKFQNPFHPHVNNGLGMLTLGRTRRGGDATPPLGFS